MDQARVHEIVASSGGILYLMALLLLIALTVIVERSWYLHSTISRGAVLSRAVAQLNRLDRVALESLAEKAKKHPLGALLAVPLNHPELVVQERMSDMLEEAILWQAPQIDSRLWMLDTIVTLAPLLGLLGTIIGMFNTFQVLGSAASAPTAVTGGVAEALVATGSGLLIAILGLVAFNALNNSVRLAMHQMETLKIMLVNRMDGVHAAAWDHGGEVRSISNAPIAVRA